MMMTGHMSEPDEFDGLTAEELVYLAMRAFISVHNRGELSDEKLLDDILLWFHLMTDSIEDQEDEDIIAVRIEIETDRGLH